MGCFFSAFARMAPAASTSLRQNEPATSEAATLGAAIWEAVVEAGNKAIIAATTVAVASICQMVIQTGAEAIIAATRDVLASSCKAMAEAVVAVIVAWWCQLWWRFTT